MTEPDTPRSEGTLAEPRSSPFLALWVSAQRNVALSALVPGLGQLFQGRFVAAALQFGTVGAYLIGAGGLGGRRALLIALAWNVWSVVDAWWHETDCLS